MKNLLCLLCALASLVGCDKPRPRHAPPEPAVAQTPATPNSKPRPMPSPKPLAWPAPGFTLSPPSTVFSDDFGMHKIFLDAGHGNPGNTGNISCLCIEEQDFNLAMTQHLAPLLTGTDHFKVRLSRNATPGPKYRPRLAAAQAFGAEVIISIHSDVRGEGREWSPAHGKRCMHNLDAPGFSILWSDEGPLELTLSRHRLARAMAKSLTQTGFLPYGGEDYEDLYDLDPLSPGVFVDRHPPGERIFFLRKPRIPSIIIETHHAWDPREEQRFQKTSTRDAFGKALVAALEEHFSAT
ncbi:MAG: N-acetylmuramoyl-L-alanine amidase [Deltaproteobacteria bacterium]|nr:N-acetylmuramoyl-L-alanine amidase [Deltaproteobacteria bacterium]